MGVKRGDILGGRYQVEEPLGSGGMGQVVAATDLRSGDKLALKLPLRDGGPREVTRFEREARALRQLSSPHVPRVYDTGTFVDGEDPVPFIAFEYLEGEDLATRLIRGPLDVATVVAIAIATCDALDEAHALGIVHRDIKPANLFLTRDGGVKVLDFGISRSRDPDDRMTVTGALVGSPAYMPPERMRPSLTVDARSDVWSLGVVLFEAVAGRLPFESPVFPDLCLKILLDDAPALPGIAFDAVVRRCLEKEPDDRYQSARELANALAPFAGGASLPVRRRARTSLWVAALAAAAIWLAPETRATIAVEASIAFPREAGVVPRIPTVSTTAISRSQPQISQGRMPIHLARARPSEPAHVIEPVVAPAQPTSPPPSTEIATKTFDPLASPF